MAQKLGAFAIHAEDTGSTPRTHGAAHSCLKEQLQDNLMISLLIHDTQEYLQAVLVKVTIAVKKHHDESNLGRTG